jgi:eukaryotic-like serine/threonine-protein kinase
MTEETLFAAALEKRTPAERAAFLIEVCSEDVVLRQRVEALLHSHDLAEFLKNPAVKRPVEDRSVPQRTAEELPATVDGPISTECPGSMIGPYKLLQKIGEGGMGAVFMAEQTQPVQRKVALKVIKAGMDSRQVIARFEAERQALAMMDHVNIARVVDAGATESGRPYFVMELVHGVAMTEYCDNNHLTPRERLELFVPVCQAIQHAHQKGIIHRDIKPSNVIITLYDGKPVPKVIDFGVAKATEQKLTERTLFTQFGTMVGTLEYMSPEQAEMSALGVDTRSDIYSLGVLLYELLTGSTPLTRRRVREAAYGEILRMIKEDEPPRPSTRLSESGESLASISAQRHTEPAKLAKLVRGELDWIVMKCLEKDRNRRYETANGFAADVLRYLHDEPVQACPPSVIYQFRKFAWRNKGALLTAAIVGTAALLAFGTLGWAVRDRRARDDEVSRERLARGVALDGEVQAALVEAGALIADSKWPEAVAVVERTDKLLATAGRKELPRELQELQKDLAMAQRLEDIYSRPKTDEINWGQLQDDSYSKAFADFAIDFRTLAVREAAEKIRERSIRLELCRALDFWSNRRHALGNPKPPAWQQLLEIATFADPDPRRVQLREALAQGNRTALERWAASADIKALQPRTLYLLGTALYNRGATEQAIVILLQAHAQHPEDWWISATLGSYCLAAHPSQYNDAIRFFTAAQAVRPRNPYILYGFGQALLQKPAQAEAIAIFSRAVELKPDDCLLWLQRGIVYDNLGQSAKAVDDFSKAIELAPKFANAWNNRGAAYTHMSQLEKAVADYSTAIELAPQEVGFRINRGTAYYNLGQGEKAIDDHTKAIELDTKAAGAWMSRGLAYTLTGQPHKAITDLSKAIELDPKDARIWHNRALAYSNLGRQDKAIDDSSRAIDLDPKQAVCWSLRGLAYAYLEQQDKAIADCSKGIGLDARSAAAWYSRGLAYGHLKQLDKSIADFSKSIELQPDFYEAWLNRGVAFAGLKQWDNALVNFAQAIKIKPKQVMGWQSQGDALRITGKFDEAIASYDEANKLKPDAVWWRLRGQTQRAAGRGEEAAADYSKALDLNPTDGRIWDERGMLFLSVRQPEKALADFTKSIAVDPKLWSFWKHRSLAYRALDRWKESIADLSTTVELAPQDGDTLNELAWLLATCPDPTLRDPRRALKAAKKAVELEPKQGTWWNTLGVAHYRAGDWKSTLAALEKSMQLRNGGDANDWLFLAMAHSQLGHEEEAGKWYAEAVQWIDKNAPQNEELRRFRTEAVEVLKKDSGVKPQAPHQK